MTKNEKDRIDDIVGQFCNRADMHKANYKHINELLVSVNYHHLYNYIHSWIITHNKKTFRQQKFIDSKPVYNIAEYFGTIEKLNDKDKVAYHKEMIRAFRKYLTVQ